MIRNIIFDLGGVILTLEETQVVKRFETLGLKDAGQRLDPYEQTGIFGDLEEGKIDAEGFRKELSLLVGHEVSHEECADAWQGYIKEIPERNLETLLKLRQEGYRLILLSNTNPFMMEFVESDRFDGKGHPLAYYFDAEYKSFEVKLMKPDEHFYRYVLSREKILPEETLYVDDGPRNVAAASELGLRTLCPKNGEDWTGRIYDCLQAK